MKKLFFAAIAVSSLMFTSCGSDNDNPNPGPQIINVTDPNLAGLTVSAGQSAILDASVAYTLKDQPLIVETGGSITIPAGTTIKAEGGKDSYVAIQRGAQVFINGTAEKPVVMTSSKSSPAAQDWGGFIVCGNAKTNVGVDATAEVAGLTYGGENDDDNSGVIKYLKVQYTGAIISESKEFNGITFYAVGNKTVIENIASLDGSDDGVEFFGGNVNASNIYMTNADDDGLDFADGFRGTIKNVYINGVKKAGIEGSNNESDGDAEPVTTATIENVTVINGGLGMSEGVIYFKEGGGKITYKNIYAVDAVKVVKAKSDDTKAQARLTAGDLVVNPIQFAISAPSRAGIDSDWEGYELGENNGAGNGADLPNWAEWAE